MEQIYDFRDSLETIGDRRMFLSTTSMAAGYAAECLISFERYKAKRDPTVLRSSTNECKKFIEDFVATLERKKEAPFALRRLAALMVSREGSQLNESVENWRKTYNALNKAQRGESLNNLDEIIGFL